MVQQASLPPVVVGQWVPMTFEEFLDWAPSKGQAEWVDGEGIIYVGSIPRHAQLQDFLHRLLGDFAEAHDLGQTLASNVVLRLPTRPSGREPDLMVVLAQHRDQIGERWVEGPVDLVVELVSDDSTTRDRRDKLREYEAEGVREYLVVDARLGKHGFDFYRLDETGRYEAVQPDAAGRYHSAVLPGFWIDPTWLRMEPLPKVAVVLARIEADSDPDSIARE